MTGRAADVGNSGTDHNSSSEEERRGRSRRVRFEALVAVGDAQGGFEAESIDVSPEGMRLRTAYLPTVGDRLVCRFDGPQGEVAVEGEVLWRVEAPRGGEFAIRFDGVDAEIAEAIKALCVQMGPPPDAAVAAGDPTARGTRVRLHIEGLGSPMKARVRDADDGEVLVGSNLEFLRVGRSLELEDVDHGMKREAYIDCVKVEIDPTTSVPQLVVALRYGRAPEVPKASRRGGPMATLPFGAKMPAGNRPEDVGVVVPARLDAPEPPREPSRPEFLGAAAPSADPPPARESDDERDVDAADDIEESERLVGRGARAARAGLAMANRIGPALSGLGARAKGAAVLLAARVAKARAERADAKKATQPRRMTAPPPAGALKSEGRRLVRDDGDEMSEEPTSPKRSSGRKAAIIGGTIGLCAVLGAFGVSRALDGAGPKREAVAAADAPAKPAAAPAQPGAAGPGEATANVPLFGATPMSTTETVPATPPSDPVAAAANAADRADDEAGPGEEDEPGFGEDAPGALKKEFGSGDVKKPIVLKIRMDGPVEGLRGTAGERGFTLLVPDRKSLTSTSDLSRKDKRLEAVNVLNNERGVEVTVQFRGEVPAYIAKAKGDRLEIALGRKVDETKEPKKVASKGPSKKKDQKADAKAKSKKSDKPKKK